MAAFSADQHTFRVISELPDVPLRVLHAACDPGSPRLLAWPIYRGIARACGASEAQARVVFTRYLAAKTEQEDIALPPDRPVTAQTSASAVDPPTVPRLRLPVPLAPPAPRPGGGQPLALRQISTSAGFAGYLKALVEQSGLSLRDVEKHTRALAPKAASCRSTLSETLKRGKIPTSEPVMTTLLKVLFAHIANADPRADTIERRAQEALHVWRYVLRPPPGAPVLAASAGYGPLVHTALSALARAEQTARELDSPDAPGLAHAQQILKELLT